MRPFPLGNRRRVQCTRQCSGSLIKETGTSTRPVLTHDLRSTGSILRRARSGAGLSEFRAFVAFPASVPFNARRRAGMAWVSAWCGNGGETGVCRLAGRLADVFGALLLERCQSFSVLGWQNIGGRRASEINLPAIPTPAVCAAAGVTRHTVLLTTSTTNSAPALWIATPPSRGPTQWFLLNRSLHAGPER